MEDENVSRYKDRPKNPRRRVQMTPEHERAFGVQEPIQHFWSAERHFKSAKIPCFGFWPNSFQVTIRHTIFDLFTNGCVRIQTLIVRTYFLEPSDLYK